MKTKDIITNIKTQFVNLLGYDAHKIDIILKDENVSRVNTLNDIAQYIQQHTKNRLLYVFYVKSTDGYSLYELLESDVLDVFKIKQLIDIVIDKEQYYYNKKLEQSI